MIAAISLTLPNARWKGPGATRFGKKTIRRRLTKPRSALSLTLFFLILRCRKPMAAKSPPGLNRTRHCTERRLFFSRHWSRKRRQDRVSGSKRSEEHTSELQSLRHRVCRLLLEKKNA